MIRNTPVGGRLFFHAKFIKLTYSCGTQKTGRREDGNTCAYITQNKLSEWSINNGAVNMCARYLPTDHSFGSNTDSHMHLWGETGNSRFLKAPAFRVSPSSCFSTLLLFICFLPSFSSKACRCVALQKKTGSRPPALVSMGRHARKTKTSELAQTPQQKNCSGDHPWRWQVSNQDQKTNFLDQGATR